MPTPTSTSSVAQPAGCEAPGFWLAFTHALCTDPWLHSASRPNSSYGWAANSQRLHTVDGLIASRPITGGYSAFETKGPDGYRHECVTGSQ